MLKKYYKNLGGEHSMENIKRLKNDLNTFILKLMDKKASKDEIKILIKAGDIIDKYRN